MRRVWGWAPFPGVSWKLRHCCFLQTASHPCWNCARGTAPGSPCLEWREVLCGEAPHRRGSPAEKRGERNSRCPCSRESCGIREGSAEGRAVLSPQQDTVPSLVPRARPSPGVKDTPSALGHSKCHHSGARGPHPEVPSDVQHPEFSLLAGFPCVHAFPLGVSALALLFSPFFDLSPIHIFAFQVNVASWALGGASSTALLSATAVLLPSLIPLHLPQPCQASPASLTHLSLC